MILTRSRSELLETIALRSSCLERTAPIAFFIAEGDEER